MLVKDIMTVNVVTINQNQTLLELQGLMSDDNIRRVPVVNDAGMVVGIITDKDVRMASPSEASTLSRYGCGVSDVSGPDQLRTGSG